MTKHKKYLIFLLSLFYSLANFAQINPEEKTFILLPGESFNYEFVSSPMGQKPITILDGFDIDLTSTGGLVVPRNLGSGKYKIQFDVATDAVDKKTSFVIEYFKYDGFYMESRFTKLNFIVVDSYLNTTHDYISTKVNGGSVDIDVIQNDKTSHGPIELIGVAFAENGLASVNRKGNGVISFTPDSDFAGMAYVNYVVENVLGKTETGTLSVCVLDPSREDSEKTLEYYTTNRQALSILLPSDGFKIDPQSLAKFGEINFVAKDAVEYLAPLGTEGVDEFVLVDKNLGLVRNIRVTNIMNENLKAIRDDEYYTAVNQPIRFNVFKNDLKKNPIISHSDELIEEGNGIFLYTPPAGAEGTKTFQYITASSGQRDVGQITIHISNFFPEDRSLYEFVTKENTDLVLNYKIPSEHFSFSVKQQAAHGNVSILEGDQLLFDYCNDVDGFNMMRYRPRSGFTGDDEFVISFSTDSDSGNSRDIKVKTEVLAYVDDCACVGQDCVWPGDANHDGIVSVSDVLTLGYHIGDIGPARKDDNPNEWIGQHADDWDNSLALADNPKYIDSDGNGIVTIQDTIAISEQYNKTSNLISKEDLTFRNAQLIPVFSQEEINFGDLLKIDVYVGSEDFPITDVHGIAYSVNINPSYLDSSSIKVQYHQNTFLDNNSAMIHMDFLPYLGRVDVVSSRTTSRAVSGSGLLHSLGIAPVEDDDDFKESLALIEIPIRFGDIVVYDSFGKKYALEDVEKTIIINRDNLVPDNSKDSELLLFPNPSSNVVNVHLNGANIMEQIQVLDLMGRVIMDYSELNTTNINIETSSLSTGIYVIQVKTISGLLSQKFQVIQN